MNTSLTSGWSSFIIISFLDCSTEFLSWSYDQSGNSPGTDSCARVFRTFQTESVSFPPHPKVCHISVYPALLWSVLYVPFQWERLIFPPIFLSPYSKVLYVYENTTTCSVLGPESPLNWSESWLSVLRSGKAPGGDRRVEKHCQGLVIKQNKTLAPVMIYRCPPRLLFIFDRSDKFGFA